MKTEIEKTRIDEIKELHQKIGGYLRTTLDGAIRVGELLQEQKAGLKHGAWLPWIKENLPFSERLARDYMRFYNRREELKTANLADLTDARKFISQSRSEKNKAFFEEQADRVFIYLFNGPEKYQEYFGDPEQGKQLAIVDNPLNGCLFSLLRTTWSNKEMGMSFPAYVKNILKIDQIWGRRLADYGDILQVIMGMPDPLEDWKAYIENDAISEKMAEAIA